MSFTSTNTNAVVIVVTKEIASYHHIDWPLPKGGVKRDGVTYVPFTPLKRPIKQKKPWTLKQLNAWMMKNHAAMLELARQNCRRLTGRDCL